MRRSTPAIALVCSAALLGGCALVPKGGQSIAEAQARIESIPGVASAEIVQDTTRSGLSATVSTTVWVSVEDGYTVGDADAAFDWLLGTAWSINDSTTNGVIAGEFEDSSGEPLDWDWADAATARGIDASVLADSVAAAGTLTLLDTEAHELYGDTASTVPEAPDDLLVAG